MDKPAELRTLTALKPLRILHLDIETAPNLVYAWGLFKQHIAVNQIVRPARILCWAAKWHGEKKVMFAAEWGAGGRWAMLREIHALLSEADAVCHYNGIAFDIPRLNQEFKKEGMKPPPPIPQIDLFRTVKGRFDLPSGKLEFVAPYFKVGRKQVHPGMPMWTGIEAGEPRARKQMERYNRQDTLLLERLYRKLLPWIRNHPNAALTLTAGVPACPTCGSTKVKPQKKPYRTGSHLYTQYRCKCGAWSREGKNSGPRGGSRLRRL